MLHIKLLSSLFLLLMSFQSFATPFTSCPSKAFLIQQSVAQLYGVNLVTGTYQLLSDDLGTTGKINAFGFNFHDNYLYGWAYEWGTVGRIGNDFQVEPLTITNNPNTNFFVGDVALNENAYYVYRKGASLGLYKIILDQIHPDYLVATQIIDGASLSLSIFDFAFHPSDDFAYSVDKFGDLHKINVGNGSSSVLGNVGVTGTFGAVYFDVEGTFYISRNTDGQVFRINVTDQNPAAELFAYGPNSSNNDGARCAIAPIIDESIPADSDYGDAPDSYGTTLSSNGARHGISDIYLGSQVDAEYNSNVYPSSDDESNIDDEDGINYISVFEAGLDSLMQVTVQGSGYLNIWADWNQNGQFEDDERFVTDRQMITGTETFLVAVPLDALAGYTWTRSRYSSSAGIAASGGVSDGEVEDYRVAVTNNGYSFLQQTPYFLAFEDNWPAQGDYDMNDVVIKLQSSVLVTADNKVKQLHITGELKSMGASYKNGFAIQLLGVTDSQIEQSVIRYEINGNSIEQDLVEGGTINSVLKVTENLWDYIEPDAGCKYFKTELGCNSSSTFIFTLKIPFNDAIPLESFPAAPFNPFIYATPNRYHGDNFSSHPGRGLEIHLKNHPPTSKADLSYFNQQQDASDSSLNYYYQNINGLPWALAISAGSSEQWFQPLESVDLLEAYPDFAPFVTSEGSTNSLWFLNNNAISNKTYQQ